MPTLLAHGICLESTASHMTEAALKGNLEIISKTRSNCSARKLSSLWSMIAKNKSIRVSNLQWKTRNKKKKIKYSLSLKAKNEQIRRDIIKKWSAFRLSANWKKKAIILTYFSKSFLLGSSSKNLRQRAAEYFQSLFENLIIARPVKRPCN